MDDDVVSVRIPVPSFVEAEAAQSERVPPEMADWSTIIPKIFKQVETNRGGEKATYIPQLAHVNEELFGVCKRKRKFRKGRRGKGRKGKQRKERKGKERKTNDSPAFFQVSFCSVNGEFVNVGDYKVCLSVCLSV
jgi:hypothetical protein